MQFALLIYESAGDFARRRGPEAAAYWSSWAAYSGALDDRMPLGACLQAPETGVVLRRGGETRQITDGPYSDSPEQLGGVIMIDMDSVEDALSWRALRRVAQARRALRDDSPGRERGG